MPNSRCSVTMRGSSWRVTVSIPSAACTIRVANSISANGTLTGRWRRALIASAVIPEITSPRAPAA